MASCTISPKAPPKPPHTSFFWQGFSVPVICTSALVAAAAAATSCMLCTAISHQLDPVTPVCAVVGIGEGVQQQLMNAVRVPAAPIHQRDEDVGHASRAGQDEPRCRIGNAFVHPLRRESSRVQSRVLTPRWKKKKRASY